MIFRQNENVVARREGEKTLIFHQKTGWLCILNNTSTFIWEHLDGQAGPEEITASLGDQFDIPEELSQPQELLGLVEKHLDLMQKGQLLEAVAA